MTKKILNRFIVLSDTHLACDKIRDNIVLNDFERIVKYAVNKKIKSIAVLGDTFEKNSNCIERFITIIKNNANVDFYVIFGNHERENRFVDSLFQIPENLFLFYDSWSYYDVGRVRIIGISTQSNEKSYWHKLCYNRKKYNIVLMHAKLKNIINHDDGTVVKGSFLFDSTNCANMICLGHTHNFTTVNSKPFIARENRNCALCIPGTFNRFKKRNKDPEFITFDIVYNCQSKKLEVSSCDTKSVDDIDVISCALGIEKSVIIIANKMLAKDFAEQDVKYITNVEPTRIRLKYKNNIYYKTTYYKTISPNGC